MKYISIIIGGLGIIMTLIVLIVFDSLYQGENISSISYIFYLLVVFGVIFASGFYNIKHRLPLILLIVSSVLFSFWFLREFTFNFWLGGNYGLVIAVQSAIIIPLILVIFQMFKKPIESEDTYNKIFNWILRVFLMLNFVTVLFVLLKMISINGTATALHGLVFNVSSMFFIMTISILLVIALLFATTLIDFTGKKKIFLLYLLTFLYLYIFYEMFFTVASLPYPLPQSEWAVLVAFDYVNIDYGIFDFYYPEIMLENFPFRPSYDPSLLHELYLFESIKLTLFIAIIINLHIVLLYMTDRLKKIRNYYEKYLPYFVNGVFVVLLIIFLVLTIQFAIAYITIVQVYSYFTWLSLGIFFLLIVYFYVYINIKEFNNYVFVGSIGLAFIIRGYFHELFGETWIYGTGGSDHSIFLLWVEKGVRIVHIEYISNLYEPRQVLFYLGVIFALVLPTVILLARKKIELLSKEKTDNS